MKRKKWVKSSVIKGGKAKKRKGEKREKKRLKWGTEEKGKIQDAEDTKKKR